MNVFFHELRTYRMSTAIWAVSLSAIVLLFLSIFPSFRDDVGSSMKILSSLPLAVREALGISLGTFFTLFGFYSYLFTFVTLAGAIQAMNLGVGLVAKEVSAKTADFLLTKPITRASVISQKLLAGVTLLLLTNVVFVTVAFFAARSAEPNFDIATFLLLSTTLLLVQLVFLSVGALIAALAPKIKSVIAVSLPTAFAFFIIGSLGAIIGSTTVRYVTPFKFFDPGYIIAHHCYEFRFVLLEAGILVVSLLATYLVFNKKDIAS